MDRLERTEKQYLYAISSLEIMENCQQKSTVFHKSSSIFDVAGKRIHQWQVLSQNIFIPQVFIFSISYSDGQSCLVSRMMAISKKFYNCCPWRLPVLWSNVKIYLCACTKHLSLWYLSTLHGLKMNSEAAWRIVSKIYLNFGFCDIMWFHWADRGTQRNIRHFTKIWGEKLFLFV